jgi:hypothetical protein
MFATELLVRRMLSVTVSVMLQVTRLEAPTVLIEAEPLEPAVTVGVGPVNDFVATPGHASTHAYLRGG